MEFEFRFGLVTIEAMFNMVSAGSFKQGVIVDRARFWNTPGALHVTPAALLKLFELGVIDVFWFANFPPPAPPPRGTLKWRG